MVLHLDLYLFVEEACCSLQMILIFSTLPWFTLSYRSSSYLSSLEMLSEEPVCGYVVYSGTASHLDACADCMISIIEILCIGQVRIWSIYLTVSFNFQLLCLIPFSHWHALMFLWWGFQSYARVKSGAWVAYLPEMIIFARIFKPTYR